MKLHSLNQRIGLIRTSQFDKKFLFYHLNRHKHFLAFNNGENQTNLRKDDVLRCPLLVPPLAIQKQIVNRLDKLGKESKRLKFFYEQKLENLKKLKKSILQNAFNCKGKIQ